MLESIAIIIGIICGSITASVALRTLMKAPHITFSLKKAEICLYDGKCEEKIVLLMAPVGNVKKRLFGDAARKVSGIVLYRAPASDGKLESNASIGLPWLNSFGIRTKVKQLESEEDIQRALEDRLFDRKERDIPQGRGEHLAVAYGIEKTNKLYLASNPPIGMPLPPADKPRIAFTGFFLRLEVAGENLPSTPSAGTMIMARSWSNWSYPKEVRTIWTPSRLRNLLLRVGFGRKTKVITSETAD